MARGIYDHLQLGNSHRVIEMRRARVNGMRISGVKQTNKWLLWQWRRLRGAASGRHRLDWRQLEAAAQRR